MKRFLNPPKAFVARLEVCSNTEGEVRFRTLYFTGVENGDPWSEARADAKEMSIAAADKVAAEVRGVRGLVVNGESFAAAVAAEHRQQLERQGLD